MEWVLVFWNMVKLFCLVCVFCIWFAVWLEYYVQVRENMLRHASKHGALPVFVARVIVQSLPFILLALSMYGAWDLFWGGHPSQKEKTILELPIEAYDTPQKNKP